MTHKRPSGERDQHHRIVCAMAGEFRDDGYSVATDGDCEVREMADLPEYDNYPSGCGDGSDRIPDVFATQSGETDRNIEVETASTVSDERTKCQLKTFENEGEAVVVVPDDNSDELYDNLDDWGLRGDVSVWTY